MDDLERLVRGMSAAGDEQARLGLTVETAVQLVQGCVHASVTVVSGKEIALRAATDPAAEKCDLLQVELGEGPSLDAVRTQTTVVSQDLARDEQWPRWGPDVSEQLGICSVATLLLQAEGRPYGALNLYSSRRDAFDATALATAETLAGHAGVALVARREIEQLRNAVGGRTVIGQAQGLLMERLGVDEAQAFAYLKRASSHQNRKLAQVAAELVEKRRLPLRPPD